MEKVTTITVTIRVQKNTSIRVKKFERSGLEVNELHDLNVERKRNILGESGRSYDSKVCSIFELRSC